LLKTVDRPKYFCKGGYCVTEQALIGLYRFITPFPLFDEPEHYSHAQVNNSPGREQYAIMTGRSLLSNGVRMAVEIIATHKGHTRVCWTVEGALSPVTTEELSAGSL